MPESPRCWPGSPCVVLMTILSLSNRFIGMLRIAGDGGIVSTAHYETTLVSFVGLRESRVQMPVNLLAGQCSPECAKIQFYYKL